MLLKYAEKKALRFHCESCDYYTSKKSSWNQHLATRKHMNATKCYKNAKNATEKYAPEISHLSCSGCGKTYKHASSLYRHKKICSKYAQQNLENDELITMTKTEYKLALENSQLKGKLKSYETSLLPKAVNTAINSSINSNNTQNINIQLHLNETFKNAVNFSQFCEDIKVSLKELQYTHEHGYIEGVSNIMIKAVQDIETDSRPIHHVPNHPDKNQQGLYIKDCDEWSKDTDGRFQKGIDSITQKHIDALKEWEEKNPNWFNTESGQDTYNSMVAEITAGVANTREKIKKLISSQVKLPVPENKKIS
mgnify:FL=1